MPINSSEYIVSKALLDADREFEGENPYGKPIDIYGMIAEVSIFESIEKAYLTASIVVVDTQKVISDIVNMQGTEKLTLTMSTDEHGEGSVNQEFTLNLRVVSIIDEKKTNDYTMVYVLNCVSEHAFNDANVQLSRSYKGQLEDIAEKVLEDYLDVKVDRDPSYWEGQTIQGRLKLIVPYLSPLDTVSWLTERGCKDDTSPIFMWQTVWDDGNETKVRLGDFATMASFGSEDVNEDAAQPAIDWNRSFVYSSYGPNNTDLGETVREPGTKENRTMVVELGSGNTTNSDTLKMINEGAVGSRLVTLDTYTTQKFDRHFNLEEFLKYYRDNALTPLSNIFSDAFDPDHKVKVGKETKSPAEFDGRGRNLVTSYGTYEWENSYHDVPDPTAAMNKVRKGVVKNLMYRDLINVTVPGYSFMIEKLGAGDCIGLRLPESFTDDEGGEQISEPHTGVYMVLALRHVFVSNTHRVVATCCKIEDVLPS